MSIKMALARYGLTNKNIGFYCFLPWLLDIDFNET